VFKNIFFFCGKRGIKGEGGWGGGEKGGINNGGGGGGITRNCTQ